MPRQHGTGFVLNIPSFLPEVSETVVQAVERQYVAVALA
jgi:hypothetical protein